MTGKGKVSPWVRVAIMIFASLVVGALALHFTGRVLPDDPKEAIVFQNALLLIVLGSALLEHHYTKPADSVVNSLMGLITLLSVFNEAPRIPWIVVSFYCLLVFLTSTICVAVSSDPAQTGWRKKVADRTYRPSIVFGQSRVLFTIVFLAGLSFFYDVSNPITIALVLFWGAFIAIWPLKIPELITSWFKRAHSRADVLGTITRIDSPNILRIVLDGNSDWCPRKPPICALPNGKSVWVQPLYSQFQDGRLLATGLLTKVEAPSCGVPLNSVANSWLSPTSGDLHAIATSLGGGTDAVLTGFIVERSSIGAIRFETIDTTQCSDGMLVWCEVHGDRVYYQVVAGETQEESFSSDKHGFQVATAAQLGILVEHEGFNPEESPEGCRGRSKVV